MPNTFWGRIDSNAAGNPSPNLTVDAAIQITFVPDGPTGDLEFDADGLNGTDGNTLVQIGMQT